ncbi:hypothetical protein BTIS_0239 [Bifidobacterium tissieri]|uniref:Fibronectin type-III domain-containing protein n=1 Tax=Bifidobacterium tissieri TaxID=1630162 RepID=A0A261FJT4_9BIFI|nr:zinc ribbon domain-containing protein [Bifidobacterium tissieri]OZG59086.1 hypothetical protein BTIS_0239 [Bifidobacterium tissieri]
MAQDNLYLILGLFDFSNSLESDPAPEQRIAQAVAAVRPKLSQRANRAGGDPAAQRALELLKTVNTLNMPEQRQQVFLEAKNIVEKSITKQVKLYAARGYILTGEITKIAQKVSKQCNCAISDADVRSRVHGVPVKEQEEGPKGTELARPKSYSKYHGQESKLKVYGHANLYDMLDPGNTKVRSVPTATWRAKAEAAKKALPNKVNMEVSDHQKLYNLCIGTAFKDDTSRAAYDEYLAYESLMSILDEVKEVTSVTKKLDSALAEQYIDRLYEAGAKNGHPITRDEASGYLLWFCGKSSILYMPPAEHADESTLPEPCPWCGALADPDAVNCSSCGGRILENCPQCHHTNRADVHYCGQCGFDYTNLAQASAMCDEAKSLAGALRFDDADQLVDQAANLWPGFAEAKAVKQTIAQQRTLVGPSAQRLTDAVKALNLIEAGKLYDGIRRRSPKFENRELRDAIDAGVARAKAAMEAAPRTISSVLEAYNACHDYPGLAAALAANPPKPVADVTVRPDGTAHCMYVSWPASSSKEVSYVLLRKQGSHPLDEHDGERLTETSGTSFVDRTVEAGEPYGYAVVVKLGPLSSALTASKTVTVLFDVANVKVSPSQSTIQITWNGIPGTGVVAVWRRTDHAPTRPGDGEQVTNVVSSGLLDQGLRNDVTYYYAIFVSYRLANGRTVYSQGVQCSGIPAAPPEPIDFLFAQLQADGSFTLEWEVPEGGEARFSYTTGDLSFKDGDIVAESELNAQTMPLPITATGDDTGTFTLPDDSIYHIVAATVKNGQAVIGASATVSSRRAVEITNITASGANAVVLFDWPEESDRVLLAWRTDRYPASAEERGATVTSVNRRTYDLHKAIIVKGIQPNVPYYFSLFARLGSGDSASYSAGSNRMFSFGKASKATYHVEVRKSLLGKIKSATLVIESTDSLPEMELRAQMGVIPAYSNQGLLVASIPAQNGGGTHRIELPAGSLNKGMFAKLFFKDLSIYQTSSLTQAAGTSPEIG